MAGYDIAQLKGTPLYDLARNANVYGGKTLSRTEMVFFQQQCREMGFDPAKYGLEVETEDLEGADYKETQKAQRNLTNSIDQAYQGQFGKKNNAVQVAKDAETRAYSTINTAKEAFVRNHGDDTKFIPESLGLRPNFMAPEYKDNLTKYVSDLNAWGNKVAEQYRNADAMTNKELAELIMQNDNEHFEALRNEIQNGTAQIIEQVQIEGGATRVAIRNAKGEIINAVRTAEGHIMSEVQWQSWYTREITINQGERTRQHVTEQNEQTQVLNGISEKITSELDDGYTRAHIRTAANNMRNRVLQSNLPFEQKQELLTHLASFLTQRYISGDELAAEEARINGTINGYNAR